MWQGCLLDRREPSRDLCTWPECECSIMGWQASLSQRMAIWGQRYGLCTVEFCASWFSQLAICGLAKGKRSNQRSVSGSMYCRTGGQLKTNCTRGADGKVISIFLMDLFHVPWSSALPSCFFSHFSLPAKTFQSVFYNLSRIYFFPPAMHRKFNSEWWDANIMQGWPFRLQGN